MFSKTSDQSLPASAPQTPSGFGKSVLASDLVIKGEIVSTSTVEVLGQVDGKISAKTLIVGVEGQVKGSLSADTIDLRGTFDGSIAAHNLSLRATSDVRADVHYATLAIESGAVVEGKYKANKA